MMASSHVMGNWRVSGGRSKLETTQPSKAVLVRFCAALLLLAACGGGEPTAPAPSHLVFRSQPTTVPANVAIAPLLQVALLDVSGTRVRNATDMVTIAIGANPASGALSGTTTVKAVHGVAYFRDLSIDRVGEGYTLTATSGDLLGATSAVFGVFDTLTPPAHLDSLHLASTTLTIGGPGVAYTAQVINESVGTLAVVYIQAYLDQGGSAIHAAGGSNVSCSSQSGDLPPGTCPFRFEVNVPSTGGSLVAGIATARFELHQWLSPAADVLLDSATMVVTLTN